jgi:NAD(P)-dependent dehydrogenase (short-subunit alcohol dehydrogenase family)
MSDSSRKNTDQDSGWAIVTGGNRGLGFETCKQLARKGIPVILTARNEGHGRDAADQLSREGHNVIFRALDVSSSESIDQFVRHLKSEGKKIDILVNNAGIMIDDENEDTSLMKTNRQTIRETMETNVYGPLELAQKLAPLMNDNASIINLSSGMGQLSDMGAGWPAYRISKTAINAVTRMLAAELGSRGIKVNSVSPGWARTSMGGESAPLSTEEGVRTIVWLATQHGAKAPTGSFFDEDQDRMEW